MAFKCPRSILVWIQFNLSKVVKSTRRWCYWKLPVLDRASEIWTNTCNRPAWRTSQFSQHCINMDRWPKDQWLSQIYQMALMVQPYSVCQWWQYAKRVFSQKGQQQIALSGPFCLLAPWLIPHSREAQGSRAISQEWQKGIRENQRRESQPGWESSEL